MIGHPIQGLEWRAERPFPHSRSSIGERSYSFRSFKRFHSKSESSSISRSISCWLRTASRIRSSLCRGTNSWCSFPPLRRTSDTEHGKLFPRDPKRRQMKISLGIGFSLALVSFLALALGQH